MGFYYIGRPEWSAFDSFYMTIITLATVGYSEIHPMSQGARIWAIFVIIFGVSGIGAALRVFGKELVQIEIYKRRIMMNKIKTISNHFIICGYGRMGSVIIDEFSDKKLKFLVIEKSKGPHSLNVSPDSKHIVVDYYEDKFSLFAGIRRIKARLLRT